jgi:hypothetical protein
MDIDTKDYIGLLMFVVFWVLKVKFQFFLGDHSNPMWHMGGGIYGSFLTQKGLQQKILLLV